MKRLFIAIIGLLLIVACSYFIGKTVGNHIVHHQTEIKTKQYYNHLHQQTNSIIFPNINKLN